MAGIYIHIPFCRQACHYCNFHFSVNDRSIPEMVKAIQKEMQYRLKKQPDTSVDTIYLGGGTPSLLEAEHLQQLLKTLQQNCIIAQDAEVTLEANPEDIELQALVEWRRLGINRLSIGVQSFHDEDLRRMNRIHDSSKAVKAVRDAADSGFDNLSIDLIYGIQGADRQRLLDNIDQAVSLPVQHVSAYALTVEPRTVLDVRIRRGQESPPAEDEAVEQFYLLLERLEEHGFEQYEISNFSRPGFQSRHNTSYWKGIPYLGFGPSAHSYQPPVRSWNLANNSLYLRAAEQGGFIQETETLGLTEQACEFIMLQLRMRRGIDLGQFRKRFGEAMSTELEEAMRLPLYNGQLMSSDGFVRIHRDALMLADGIIAGLFPTGQGS